MSEEQKADTKRNPEPTTAVEIAEPVSADQEQLEQQQQLPDAENRPQQGYGSMLTRQQSNLSCTLLRRHMRFDPLSILFAILVLAGGLYAYFARDSIPSLIYGTIFAVLLGISTYIEGVRK